MANPFSSGALLVYAGVGPSYSPLFVGTGTRAPRQRIVRNFTPVANDLAGQVEPFDVMYQGQSAVVAVEFSRWNQPIIDRLQSTPLAAGAAPNPGLDALGSVGTLMLTEGYAYPLWVLYDYGAGGRAPKAGMVATGMASGRRYLQAILIGPDEEEKGTQANTTLLVWHCRRRYDPATGNFSLFDNNMGGLPVPD